jgi:hypothetical protein
MSQGSMTKAQGIPIPNKRAIGFLWFLVIGRSSITRLSPASE